MGILRAKLFMPRIAYCSFALVGQWAKVEFTSEDSGTNAVIINRDPQQDSSVYGSVDIDDNYMKIGSHRGPYKDVIIP